MKSICIVGIDGSGKSTIVKQLFNYFGEKRAVIQYMGQKNWELTITKKAFYTNAKNRKWSFARRTFLVIEMYYRVWKHYKEKKIVIFDRYVYEQITEFSEPPSWKNRILKSFYTICYSMLYKPNLIVYLKCDEDISLERKDDIAPEQVNFFRMLKRGMDIYYSNHKTDLIIDTGNKTIEETMNIIIEEIKKKKCFNI